MDYSELCDELPPSYDVVVSGPYMESSTSTRGSFFELTPLNLWTASYLSFAFLDDGRIDVTFRGKQSGLEDLLEATQLADLQPPPELHLEAESTLNIVIQIVGSRGLCQIHQVV